MDGVLAAACFIILDSDSSSSDEVEETQKREWVSPILASREAGGVTQQESLSGFIKGVHLKLRQQCHEGKDFQEIWEQHKNDKKTLSIYAEFMKRLATECWEKDKDRETRIQWSKQYLLSYYGSNGLLQKLVDKDKRSLEFHSVSQTSSCDGESSTLRCCNNVYSKVEDLKVHQDDVKKELSQRSDLSRICLPMLADIRIIDVGSCYAPFSSFPQFDCLSVDLHPGTKDVKQCDFLSVKVHPVESSSTTPQYICEADSITSLPQDWFHGVVFSLLLEYMPAAVQRWQCCVNAHKVLEMNGVLLVITPDSNKQHRRVQQMKDWKQAIEHIGFQRCRYTKLDHIHCMAFRKTLHRGDYSNLKDMSSNLYIPQDFNTPLSGEACDTPLSGETCDTPLSGETCDTPLSGPTGDTPLSKNTSDTPLSEATVSGTSIKRRKVDDDVG